MLIVVFVLEIRDEERQVRNCTWRKTNKWLAVSFPFLFLTLSKEADEDGAPSLSATLPGAVKLARLCNQIKPFHLEKKDNSYNKHAQFAAPPITITHSIGRNFHIISSWMAATCCCCRCIIAHRCCCLVGVAKLLATTRSC